MEYYQSRNRQQACRDTCPHPQREEIDNLQLDKHNKKETFRSDVSKQIESKKYATMSKSDPRLFLKINVSYENVECQPKEGSELRKLILWCHPDLQIMLRRQGLRAFVDGTFRCVPRPFTQCLILMIMDDETDLFIPVVYCLVDNKSQWTYWHFFHYVLVVTETRFYPKTVTCDFEKPLIRAIKEQFPQTVIVGCLFHFKQALRRKLEKLRMPQDTILAAMKRGQLDILTTIDRREIEPTLRHMQKRLAKGVVAEKWNDFFKYFNRVWMTDYDIETWNISKALDDSIDMRHRTNNALESFNAQINREFSSAHPNVFNFINVIKRISEEKLAEIKNIKDGTSRRPVRSTDNK
jgi:hypothetical protein